MLTIISILIFTFILFLILLFGKRYYDGIGLTKIEEEKEEEEDETSDDFYKNNDRNSYFSDEVIDCQETIASSDTCVTVGQDLVTILQYPMNGGKACSEKICKGVDIYNCRARGKEREVFIQRRSDNKFLNYQLEPCADDLEEYKCENTNIQRLENSDGVKWDIKMRWADYNVDGYASTWILKILPIDNSNRDSFQLYSNIKSDEYKLDTVIYLSSQDNVLSNKNNNNITYDERYFKTHISEGSDGINLICQEDNTQLIVYEPVHKACTTLGEAASLKFVKRKSDGKYLVVKGPKLLDYYADRDNSPDWHFGVDQAWRGSERNTTSFHEFCIDGDNYHINYTDDINEATGIIIEKSDTTISLRLEYEVTNFNIIDGTIEIGSYESPHKVTKYLELVNGNISLCNNWKYTKWTYPEKDYVDTKVIGLRPENAPDIALEYAKATVDWVGTWWTTPDDLICSVNRIPTSYDEPESGYPTALTWEDPETTCFYGSQDKIDISTDLFEQNYELVESNTIMRIGNEPENCKEKTEQAQECEKDYKKCISYEEFFPYHGNLTDYSFGKCVPKTSFLNKLSTDMEASNIKWSPDLADIVTKKCDQLIECDEGMESSNVFNKDDMDKQFDYLIGLIPSGVHSAIIQNKKKKANLIIENDMKPITYSDACTSKTE